MRARRGGSELLRRAGCSRVRTGRSGCSRARGSGVAAAKAGVPSSRLRLLSASWRAESNAAWGLAGATLGEEPPSAAASMRRLTDSRIAGVAGRGPGGRAGEREGRRRRLAPCRCMAPAGGSPEGAPACGGPWPEGGTETGRPWAAAMSRWTTSRLAATVWSPETGGAPAATAGGAGATYADGGAVQGGQTDRRRSSLFLTPSCTSPSCVLRRSAASP